MDELTSMIFLKLQTNTFKIIEIFLSNYTIKFSWLKKLLH